MNKHRRRPRGRRSEEPNQTAAHLHYRQTVKATHKPSKTGTHNKQETTNNQFYLNGSLRLKIRPDSSSLGAKTGSKCVCGDGVSWCGHLSRPLRGGFDGAEWDTNEPILSMASLCTVVLMARRQRKQGHRHTMSTSRPFLLLLLHCLSPARGAAAPVQPSPEPLHQLSVTGKYFASSSILRNEGRRMGGEQDCQLCVFVCVKSAIFSGMIVCVCVWPSKISHYVAHKVGVACGEEAGGGPAGRTAVNWAKPRAANDHLLNPTSTKPADSRGRGEREVSRTSQGRRLSFSKSQRRKWLTAASERFPHRDQLLLRVE